MVSKKAEAATAAIDKTRVVHDGQEYTEVKEGLGRILIPVTANATTTEKDAQAEEERQKVFYNPIQQFNRDLTVLAIKAYGEEIAAKRQKTAENKLNKRKRKRTDNEEVQPQKQEKPAQDVPMDDSAATGAAEAAVPVAQGDPMDTSEPQNDPAAATDKAAAEGNGTVKEAGNETASEATAAANEIPKAGGEARQRKLDPPKFTILDALSATGLRALRYVQELPFVTSVTANDLTPSAVEAIRRNAEHNGIADKVNATQSDARAHMYSMIAQEVTQEHARNPHLARRGAPAPSRKYDVIDLDPYGTAATFFDAAVNAVRDDGGLLCVTCTDSGVWASHGYSEKAFALYGGIPVKGFHSHEAGLRLILNGLAQTAAKQGLAIEPLLSLSIDYYLRIFVRIKKSPASVKFLAGKTMIVYSCDQGCGSWETQMLLRNKKVSSNKGSSFFYKHGLSMGPTADSLCAHCGSKTHLSGPMYGGPLHNREFIQRILDDLPNVDKQIYGTTARIEGMLQTALEEYIAPPPDPHAPIKDDELAAIEPYPFYFHPTTLAGTVHSICPDEDSFRGALRGLGYEVTRSHCKPGSIKTNAPWAVIWHIMREWVRQKAPVKVENIKEGSAAYAILRLGKDDSEKKDETATEIDKLEVVFDKAVGQDKTRKNLVRYQANPKENWGPLSRARGH
ncbi:N2-N2-dimethylguanosine tRNA methyltransferase [Apiospora kogelbergensis]|uniref:N2-N2-dimethylguanosine tRNA methyltransferase n=1 Tax=Apiospora kogelbergensis TaxID=1337665 RepID=UPI00313101E2